MWVSRDAQTIDVARTAYARTDGRGTNSSTWDPVVAVQLPLAAVAGEYTGTVAFSVV
ncbi:hypothetical protein I0C86_31670 [Plantactinospora sp. S1510]|uniref:Uncharacterized protein n=1 Tax=Plantactinospora alkalitolerans TaxID=2789879 RepID=A0ABS0H562_9ACTN|nr:hypothetical protein [Plantactinospora alkalitolerans]MBF9133484.1 hypothetical protein [Plantactinospora alkalitolerans]